MPDQALAGLVGTLDRTGEITFQDGRVQQSNFHDDEVLRLAQSPRVIRALLVGGDPALLNAISATTGQRIRSLPVRQQLRKG